MNKLILISNSFVDIEKVKAFSKKNGYLLEHYSKEEWKNSNKKDKNLPCKLPINNTASHNLSIVPLPVTTINSLKTMNEIKVEAIKGALLMAKGNASKAAEMLKIGRATLYRKIKELELNLDSVRKQLNEEEPAPILKESA